MVRPGLPGPFLSYNEPWNVLDPLMLRILVDPSWKCGRKRNMGEKLGVLGVKNDNQEGPREQINHTEKCKTMLGMWQNNVPELCERSAFSIF